MCTVMRFFKPKLPFKVPCIIIKNFTLKSDKKNTGDRAINL